jgi:hypothetical protein
MSDTGVCGSVWGWHGAQNRGMRSCCTCTACDVKVPVSSQVSTACAPPAPTGGRLATCYGQ